MDDTTSRQIAVARVVCIFFMMYIHVNPVFEGPVHPGMETVPGRIIIEVLGRASVPLLSIVSGFLLFVRIDHTDPKSYVRKRFQNLIVPMVFWNVAYLSAILTAFSLFNFQSDLHQ